MGTMKKTCLTILAKMTTNRKKPRFRPSHPLPDLRSMVALAIAVTVLALQNPLPESSAEID
jgi:hypothetical protein